jgi:hypothetical protein
LPLLHSLVDFLIHIIDGPISLEKSHNTLK